MERRVRTGDRSHIVIPLRLAYTLYPQKARIRTITIHQRINAIICDEPFDSWEMHVQTELARSPIASAPHQDIFKMSELTLNAYTDAPFNYEIVAYSTETSGLIWSSRLQTHGGLLKNLLDTK